MSSTNRGYDRHKADYYVTPQKAIEEFIDKAQEDLFFDTGKLFLDPCAGGDEENEMSYPAVFEKKLGIHMDTVDIREDSRATIKDDYLKTPYKGYHVIITNPPFNIARELIEKAINDVEEGGAVIMLLRLNFFGSKDRRSFFDEHMPNYCYVHHKRMSFTKEGGTDSIEYCHMVWIKGQKTNQTILKLI